MTTPSIAVRRDETSAAAVVPRYARSLDFDALWREFPPAPEYLSTTYLLSKDELRAMQELRFCAQIERAWQLPFYQRHWGAAGIERGDIRGLDDLRSIPTFSVHDMRAAIVRHPPWGDLVNLNPASDDPMPLVLQTSGGTTGMPRPMLYAPRDREVMNINTGRRLHMQGVRPFDVIQVALSLGLANGGFLAREGVWKYTGAIPVMTGSGAQTSTRRQIEIMQAWNTRHIAAFGSYLRHVALVMRDELRMDPRDQKIGSLITHLGNDNRSIIEDLWGAKAYDTYGTNECGSLAAECSFQSGMHIFEDSFFLEVVDQNSLAPKDAGQKGVILQTTLFKHLAPLVRFDSNDISALATGECSCGSHHRRLERMYGRSDNMIKLRGTNVFPDAVGALVAESALSNGEYVCIVDAVGNSGREELTVMVEAADASVSKPRLGDELAARFKEALGVTLRVAVVNAGDLDEMTGLSKSSKIRRLIDRRGS